MNLAVVILAAGLGTRMKSATPKLLHAIFDKTLIEYVVEAVRPLQAKKTVIVISPGSEEIKEVLGAHPVIFALQRKPRGTGDALAAAVAGLGSFRGTVLVANGDTPLITTETLDAFLRLHRERKEDLSLISFIPRGDHAYGRIVREGDRVKAVVEDRDADESQRLIAEVNSGVYAMKVGMLKLLKEIRINDGKGEYYLTDIVAIACRKGYKVGAHRLGRQEQFAGVNTRQDLHDALRTLNGEIVSRWMQEGVSFMDESSALVHPSAVLGRDTVIWPNVMIEGRTIVGEGSVIMPNSRIRDSVIGKGVVIRDCTVIESSEIREGAAVGPFAHLRPGSVIGSSCRIGNFVEIKKSVIGEGSKASHLSYLGDAQIGSGVNIGAGTITCNYDGTHKHRTIIEDGVFVGSDSQFVAPVTIGKGAYVGAGSTITADVPPYALALSRQPQVNKEEWVLKKKGAAKAKGRK